MKITYPLLLLLFLLMLGSSDGFLGRLIVNYCKKHHSFVVSIMVKFATSNANLLARFACSGSLIKFNWVVTSASCFYRNLGTKKARSSSNVTVIGGFDEANLVEGNVIKVVPFPQNEGDKPSESDDLVLLELDKPFKENPMVSTIKLATKGEADKCKQPETVSVLPVVQNQTGARGMVKKVVVHMICNGVNLVSASVCARLWSWITSRLALCGEMKPKGWFKREAVEGSLSCEQAEGSPLVCDGALVAVQSKCKRQNARSDLAQASYIKLDAYSDFIAKTVGDASLKKNNEKKKGVKATTGKPSSSGADHFDGALWKMAAGIGSIILFVYF